MIDKIEGILRPYYGHIHLHIPRIMNQIVKMLGYKIKLVKFFLGKWRLFSASILYIYEK